MLFKVRRLLVIYPNHMYVERISSGHIPARIRGAERSIVDVGVAIPALRIVCTIDQRIGAQESPDRRVVWVCPAFRDTSLS